MTFTRALAILTFIISIFASKDGFKGYFKLNTDGLGKKAEKSLGLGMAVDRRNAKNPYANLPNNQPAIGIKSGQPADQKKPALNDLTKNAQKGAKFVDIFDVPEEPWEEFDGTINFPRRKPEKIVEQEPIVKLNQNGKPVYDFSNQDSNFMMPFSKPNHPKLPEKVDIRMNISPLNFMYPYYDPLKGPFGKGLNEEKKPVTQQNGDKLPEQNKNPTTKTITKTELVDVDFGSIPDDEKTPGGQHTVTKTKVDIKEEKFDIPDDVESPNKDSSLANNKGKTPIKTNLDSEIKSPQTNDKSPKIEGNLISPAHKTPVQERQQSPHKTPKVSEQTITKVDILPVDIEDIPDDQSLDDDILPGGNKNLGEIKQSPKLRQSQTITPQKSPSLKENDLQSPSNKDQTFANKDIIIPTISTTPKINDLSDRESLIHGSPVHDKTPRDNTPIVQNSPKQKSPTGEDLTHEVDEDTSFVPPKNKSPLSELSPSSIKRNYDSLDQEKSPLFKKKTTDFDELGLEELEENGDLAEQEEDDPIELRDVVNKLKGMTKSKSTSDLMNKKKPEIKGFLDDTLIDYGNIFGAWNENEKLPWDRDLVKKTLKTGLRPSLKVSRKNSVIGTSFIRNQPDQKIKKVKRIYLIEVMNCQKCGDDDRLSEFIDRTF